MPHANGGRERRAIQHSVVTDWLSSSGADDADRGTRADRHMANSRMGDMGNTHRADYRTAWNRSEARSPAQGRYSMGAVTTGQCTAQDNNQ